MTARCWCNRPAHGSCGCCCANHDQAPPAAFQVFGVGIPASVARAADDGITVLEPSGRPVMRWRTETAKSVPGHPFGAVFAGSTDTRHRPDDGDIREYLRQKGEIQ